MFTYNRTTHFAEQFFTKYNSSTLDTRLRLNGYISNYTISDIILYIFKKVSDTFDTFNKDRKNFFIYHYVSNKIVDYLLNKSVLSYNTKEIIDSIKIKPVKNKNRFNNQESLWMFLRIDEQLDKWVYIFLKQEFL